MLPPNLPALAIGAAAGASADRPLPGAHMPSSGSDPAYDRAVESLALRFATTPEQIEAGLQGWWARGLLRTLQAYQDRYTLSDSELAAYLEMPENRLARLRQQSFPEPDIAQYERLVEGIAESAGCNPARLAALLTGAGVQGRGEPRERAGGSMEHAERAAAEQGDR